MAFIKPGSANAASLAANIDKLMTKTAGLRAFVVFNGGPEVRADLEKLAEKHKLSVPLVYLPNGQPPANFKVNPEADNTVLVYKGKKVMGNFVNVNEKTFEKVSVAAAAMLK